jgi:hypothetical protein
MGVDWDGNTSSQVFLESAWQFESSGEEPFYADYVWMEVQYCYAIITTECGAYNPSDYLTWRDAGW